MRIVIDTNVVISGIFFGGAPRTVLEAVIESRAEACATIEIVDEYREIVDEMIIRKQGHINSSILNPLIGKLQMIVPVTHVDICRNEQSVV